LGILREWGEREKERRRERERERERKMNSSVMGAEGTRTLQRYKSGESMFPDDS